MTSVHKRNTGPMLSSLRCGAKTVPVDPAGHPLSAVRSDVACTVVRRGQAHHAAIQNALKHGLYTRTAKAERRLAQELMGQSRKLLSDLK